MKKRIFSLILAVCIMVGGLAGCSGKKDREESVGKEETRAETAAKGRYVEHAVQLPFDGEGGRICDVIQLPDGTLEVYTQEEKTLKRYWYQAGQWAPKELSLLEQTPIAKQTEPYFHMIYGQDGFRYAAYMGYDPVRTYLYKIGEDGSCEAVLDGVLGKMRTQETTGSAMAEILVDFISVTKNGSIIVSQNSRADWYGADGTLIASAPQRAMEEEWRNAQAMTEKSYLTAGEKGYLRYEIETGVQLEEIPFQSDEQNTILAAGEGEDFYLCNRQGIHHITENGTMWETLIDGSLNSFGMPSILPYRLFRGQEQEFYLFYYEDLTIKIARYTYDPDMPSVPSQKLTVYGLDLKNHDTITQAAYLFQAENPDIQVELVDGSSETGASTDRDRIRALNTELLGGNGADILILDGLPTEAYIEKGILEDLQSVTATLAEKKELLPEVVKSYTQADGAVYGLPVRIVVPFVFGDQEIISHLNTLEHLSDWQKANPDTAVKRRTTYENIVRLLVTLYGSEVISEGQKPDREKLKLLFETAKAMGDACKAKVVFEESEDDGLGRVYNEIQRDGIGPAEEWGVAAKGQEIAISRTAGFNDLMMALSIAKENGSTLKPVRSLYIPSGMIGVNHNSPQKEAAMKFVSFVLSEQVQKNDLRDGYPVNRPAGEIWKQMEKTLAEVGSMAVVDGTMVKISGQWPTKEEREEIFQMVERLTTPSGIQAVLMEIIVDESKGYFEGTEDVGQAAESAAQKMELYFAE